MPPSFRRSFRRPRAFTLLEVTFAVALLSLFAVGSIFSLTQANRFATRARYETLALAIAQQRIDQVMTTPWSVLGTVPTVLTPGTITETTDPKVFVFPLNNDPFNTQSGLSSALTNYDGGDLQGVDYRTTKITKLDDSTGPDQPKATPPRLSRLLRADVTVAYTFRKVQYYVTLSTLRSADDF